MNYADLGKRICVAFLPNWPLPYTVELHRRAAKTPSSILDSVEAGL